MNSQSNIASENSGSQRTVSASVSPTRPFYWSIRRELWEYRSIYLGPLAVAAVYLFGFLFVLHSVPGIVRGVADLDAAHQREAIVPPYNFAAAAIMGVTFIVGVFYCLETLFAERRDRTILFWKSLPLSDLTVVLAKASIPLIVLPVVSYAITIVLELIMLLLSSIVLLATGLNIGNYWSLIAFIPSSFLLFYHLFTVHVLWYAPIYGWLLLLSVWSKRTPLLWTVLPPMAIAIFERLVFHTAYFSAFLASRFSGGPEMEASDMSGGFPFHPGSHLTPGHFLMSPGLWIGLVFAAAFLWAAARIRRYREPV